MFCCTVHLSKDCVSWITIELRVLANHSLITRDVDIVFGVLECFKLLLSAEEDVKDFFGKSQVEVAKGKDLSGTSQVANAKIATCAACVTKANPDSTLSKSALTDVKLSDQPQNVRLSAKQDPVV